MARLQVEAVQPFVVDAQALAIDEGGEPSFRTRHSLAAVHRCRLASTKLT
jgi:hypothetical protein